ncbi:MULTISPECIES: phospholipid scramblase-related protein [Flammeovirga]|uniref:RNAase n=1 Tax=Flammeovirga agarivorans TaxID=2726742 RepID=A0A7X8SHK2_9BACT|nr:MULTISPECIES: phospholipid scramblase-related protein [Flammeovirga]NLR90282.1 RNAase [Flammeovirga agarivorans]
MNSLLNRNTFFVKEHVGMFKAANNYDIYDPETNQIILECREDNLGFFTKILRFTDYKTLTPFEVEIRTPQGEKVLTVKRGVSLWLSKVEVFDERDQLVGYFKQRFFSIGGKFEVFDPNDVSLCMLKGKWTSWDFRFVKDDFEFAHVSKEFAGIMKEMFTTADNYALEINPEVPENHPLRLLILGAVMCIDMVLKER